MFFAQLNKSLFLKRFFLIIYSLEGRRFESHAGQATPKEFLYFFFLLIRERDLLEEQDEKNGVVC